MPLLQPETVARFRPLADLVPAHWRTGSTAAADGTELHWTDTGSHGAPVVLLHGAQVDGLSWLRTAQALEAGHRVIMARPPRSREVRQARGGHVVGDAGGRRPGDPARRARAAAGGGGHSMGAEVAGRLAAVEALRGVVLADPPLQSVAAAMAFDIDAPPPWMQSLLDTLRALKTQPHADRMVTGLGLLPPGGATQWDEADYVSFVEGQARFDLDLYRHTDTGARYLVESPDVIADISCPILLLTARPMMPGVDIEAGIAVFKRHWRHGRHVHFHDSGHAIPIEQFDRFVEVLTRFIDEQTGA